jgi:tRNA-dihydrouridine synthase A
MKAAAATSVRVGKTGLSSTFSVAPMMRHTNRHFRSLFRLISRRCTLFTEMVMTEQIVANPDKEIEKRLGYSIGVEEPLVLQLGGNDPNKLAAATKIAYDFGYLHVNLNCGCPSGTVASTHAMGASMMLEPELTAECCAAMKSACSGMKISVKCRVGVDDMDSYDDLARFVQIVHQEGGVDEFQVHARKALLGIGTISNRDVPPLRYDLVYRLIADFPNIDFHVNGGIDSLSKMKEQLVAAPDLSGIMVGRACVNHPYMWTHVDRIVYGDSSMSIPSRGQVLDQYIEYCQKMEDYYKRNDISLDTVTTAAMVAPVYNLFTGEGSCERYRRSVKKWSRKANSAYQILRAVKLTLSEEQLNGRVGEYTEIEDMNFHWQQYSRTAVPMTIMIK